NDLSPEVINIFRLLIRIINEIKPLDQLTNKDRYACLFEYSVTVVFSVQLLIKSKLLPGSKNPQITAIQKNYKQ
ncbi:hypothetical protein, partial [uncultured Mucilaginibacter sp.]